MSIPVMQNYTQFPTPIPNNQQVVIPQITIPQPQSYQMPQFVTAGDQVSKVKNLDEAKAYPTKPNSTYALFTEDDDVFYFKVTDKNNYPTTLKRYRFYEEEEPVPAPAPQYVTIEEYTELRNRVEDAIRKLDEVLS